MALEKFESRPCFSGLGGFAMEGAALAAHKAVEAARYVAGLFSGEVVTTPQEPAQQHSEAIRMPGDEEAQALANAAIRHTEINH